MLGGKGKKEKKSTHEVYIETVILQEVDSLPYTYDVVGKCPRKPPIYTYVPIVTDP